MFEADSFSELNFVLEFNLPEEISDDQEHVKLSVHHVSVPTMEIPTCQLGCSPMPIKISGEIHCIEYYKCIKDVLPFINLWVYSMYCPCSKLNSDRTYLFVEAKLYAYKKDGSLFKKWDLVGFRPLFNTKTEYFLDDVVEINFKFENMIEIDNKPMSYIDKYIKEYKDRDKCEFCAYHNIQGGRCYMCKNHNWFAPEIDLHQYVIKRVTEDSEKEFKSSKDGIALKEKLYHYERDYNVCAEYVDYKKEALDKELEDKYKELVTCQKEYERVKDTYISDKINKAFKSLRSMLDEDEDS